MPIPRWPASPQYAEAKKIVEDGLKRIKSLADDLARVKPKLGTYKKETLERLTKEAKAGYDAALKKNQELIFGPEYKFKQALKVVLAAEVKVWEDKKNAINQQIAAIEAEARREESDALAAAGIGKGCARTYFEMCDAYGALMEAYKKELAIAAKEKPPNPARKV